MKTKFLLLIALLLATAVGWAQVYTAAGTVILSGSVGSTVTVPVTVTGFTDVGAVSLKLAYDPAVLTYAGVDAHASLPDFLGNAAGGKVMMAWYKNPGITLTDGSVLVNIRFIMISCATTQLTWVDDDGGNGCEYMKASDQLPYDDGPTFYTSGSAGCEPQNWLNSYTILGFSRVVLGESNFVETGSVGATAANGLVDIGAYCTVAGTGAFVKAKNIIVHLPATVPVKYFEPALVTLPGMQFNTSLTTIYPNLTVPNNATKTYQGNYNDVTIGMNCKVTFSNGTIFGKVNIGKSSQVTFPGGTMNIQRIDMADGTDRALTKLSFALNASVRIKDDVTIGKSSSVNETGSQKVVFYIGSTPGHEFRVKAGGNVTLKAGVYVPLGSIVVEGDLVKPTYMKGTFIADRILSYVKNIYWNYFDNYFVSLASAQFKGAVGPEEAKLAALDPKTALLVYPNPAFGTVTFSFTAEKSATAAIYIYSSTGQIIQKAWEGEVKGGEYTTVEYENSLARGLYFVQVRSGGTTRAARLVIADRF